MTAVVTTVMFTDLVESTALMSRLGEERASVLRQEAFDLMRQAISQSGGTEVKNLGDGLMTVFDSASAALACSTHIQSSFELRNRLADEALLVRIGVAAGDADREDDDYFGVPVVEASRLCASANSGEILTTDVVRALSGSRGGLEFESVGALELKGLAQPVPASRVLWAPEQDPERIDVPLPHRLERATTEFVGRLDERKSLEVAWKAALEGERRAVFISGEPGIGKTTLATAFAQGARDDGATVLLGRCDEELGIPYQPWREALSHLASHAPQSLLEAHVAEWGGALVRLAPPLVTRAGATQVESGDPEADLFALFGAVVDLIGRTAARSPVVLMLDDLHWADRPTVQLLRHLLRSEVQMRLIVVGTFRDSEVSGDHPMAELLAVLHREPGVDRVALVGMGDDELLWLLEATAGHQMPPEGVALRDALLAETAGNPFFVGEILRHLAETRAIYLDEEGQWSLGVDLNALQLPVSIREVVTQRVARFGTEMLHLLSIAAVIGRDFDLELLERVVDMDPDTLLELCERAARAALLIEAGDGGSFTFVHALIEHTLYTELSSTRRARAHRAIAEALEDLYHDKLGDRVGELAYHWAAATQPQDASKAIAYARLAGERALDQLAPTEAVRWFSQALELEESNNTTDAHQRLDLQVSLGVALRQAGISTYRETLLAASHQALALNDTALLVRATLANNRGFSPLFDVDRARVDMIRTALARIGEGHQDEVLLLATLCSELSFDSGIDERRQLMHRAFALAESLDDHVAARVLTLITTTANIPALLPDALESSGKAVIRARATGDPGLMYWAHSCRSTVAGRASDVAEHDRNFSEMVPLADRLHQPLVSWDCLVATAVHHLMKGDHGEAELAANRALQIGLDSGQPDAFDHFSGHFAFIKWQRGELDELIALIEERVATRGQGVQTFEAGLCAMLADLGEHDRARGLLREFFDGGCALSMDPAWLAGMTFYVEAVSFLGDADVAARLLPMLEPWANQTVYEYAAVADPVTYWLGCLHVVLGDADAAEANFARATAFSERAGARFFLARVQLAWGNLLLETGRDADSSAQAQTMLEASLSSATALGYKAVARRAEAALATLVDRS